MYPGGYDPNVQDPSSQLSDYGLFPLGPIPRWNQVWGLSSYDYGHVDECLFLVYL